MHYKIETLPGYLKAEMANVKLFYLPAARANSRPSSG
jgi:hypothetical protein